MNLRQISGACLCVFSVRGREAGRLGGKETRDLAVAFKRMGDVRLERSEPDQASEWFEKGLALLESLAKDVEADSAIQRDIAAIFQSLARLHNLL
jgi:hypothetical protein